MSLDRHIRKYRSWLLVDVAHACGCCSSKLLFSSEESLKAKTADFGLGHSYTLTDDTGDVATNIDTFYGFAAKPVSRLESELVELYCRKIHASIKALTANTADSTGTCSVSGVSHQFPEGWTYVASGRSRANRDVVLSSESRTCSLCGATQRRKHRYKLPA